MQMEKLIAELKRLYLPHVPDSVLEQHLQGKNIPSLSLATAEGLTRAAVISFRKVANGSEAQHWELLCSVANALQTQLGLPAPAVSISGADGYGLWLSLAQPLPVEEVQRFLEQLRASYFPDMALASDAARAEVELPPCLHSDSGKWAAFINPGLGASFAEESGLEMAPPLAGQIALLEGLHSISDAQLRHAIALLQPVAAPVPVVAPPASAKPGLLLADATLEDIVKHLHAKNIEPTFRHLL
jgi:hypothetical protein